MTDIVAPEHAAAAAAFRRLWSAFEENRDLILMGAYAPGNDPLIDEAIVRRPELLDFLTQPPLERAPLAPIGRRPYRDDGAMNGARPPAPAHRPGPPDPARRSPPTSPPQAAGRVQMLETSRERLRQMRAELTPGRRADHRPGDGADGRARDAARQRPATASARRSTARSAPPPRARPSASPPAATRKAPKSSRRSPSASPKSWPNRNCAGVCRRRATHSSGRLR